jgi:tight adherence protein C
MNLLFYIMVATTGSCAFGLLASLMLSRTARATSRRAISIIEGRSARPDRARRRSGDLRHALASATHWLVERLGMVDDAALLLRFERAGLFASSYRDMYLACRVVGPIVALALASCIPYKRTFWMLSLSGIAYIVPDLVLTRLVKRRREKIRLSVPDMIDLLVICVDAGLGMDQAMLRVALELSKRHPAMHQELLRINREQRAGKLRMDAWQSMAKRTELPEMDAFVNMLMQTERFGTPIARALSNFADGIREKRRQHAEELAAKTSVKIIFPLVLCIFPSIFIVLLGPPGIAIARGLASSSN